MKQAFACLYFLCQADIPHATIFESLLDLIAYLGVPTKANIRRGRSATYCSEKSVQDMLYCISDVVESDIILELQQSQHFSIIFDETTDVSIIEQMVIHSRYLDDKGQLQVRYLKVLDALDGIPESCAITLSGKTIASQIINYCERNNLDYCRMRGIGTDGASTLTGKVNGAIRLIRNRQLESQGDCDLTTEAVGSHCSAHKLNLAASQAGDKVAYIKQFKSILRQLYDFYDNSAVRAAGLKEVQKMLKDSVTCGKLLQPSATRWLSTGKCAERLRDILPSIVMSLDHEAEDLASGCASHWTAQIRYNFVATLLPVCDILPLINRLSVLFQTSELDFAKLLVQLSSPQLSQLRHSRRQRAHNWLESTATSTSLRQQTSTSHCQRVLSLKQKMLQGLFQYWH